MRAFSSQRSRYLVETDELSDLLKQAPLRVVDATWYMPNDPRNAKEDFAKERLTADTQHFDIDTVVDPKSSLPHTLPSLKVFTEHMAKLNIPRDMPIVCYDNVGVFSSPRVAWMLRYFGVKDVRVLNGGLPKWKSEGRHTATEFTDFKGKGSFDFFIPDTNHAVTDIKEVHRAAYYLFNKATDMQIIDARPAPRFNGEVPEPRKGLRSGNITGSKNVPFPDLLSAGSLKSDKDLSKLFLEKNVDTTVHTINSCGSGVTACMLDLALRCVGGENSHIYDGSWSEYGGVDEPDFTHGNKWGWDEPVPQMVEKMARSRGQSEYNKLMAQVELQRKLKARERLMEEQLQSLTPYKDPQYQSSGDEEISDYEIDERDMYPEKK